MPPERGNRRCAHPWHEMETARQEGEPFFGACPADCGNAESIRGLMALAVAPRPEVRRASNPLRAAKPERLAEWRRFVASVARARRDALDAAAAAGK